MRLNLSLTTFLSGVALVSAIFPPGAASANDPSSISNNSALAISQVSGGKTGGSVGSSSKNRVDLSPRAELISNPTFWPPRLNQFYPDMELLNQDGRKTRLSDFRGQVIIIEPIATNCPVSQAYTGANKPGMNPYNICFPPQEVRSFDEQMRDLTGYGLHTYGVVFVQLIVSNGTAKPPTVEDAKAWAKHFGLETKDKKYVLVASDDMVKKYWKSTKLMVPGFQLIDRAFVLRSDASGPLPKNDLYNHFFPLLTQMFY